MAKKAGQPPKDNVLFMQEGPLLSMNYEPVAKPPQTRRMKAGRVMLSPGEEVGEHVTHEREEIIIVLRGTATLIVEGKKSEAGEGEARYIEEGKKHNVINRADSELEYIYTVCLLGNDSSGRHSHGHS